ncbi:MAG: NAD-dependent epimerase/dehydratase family protein [Actinomycetota bacterium]
MTNQQPATSNQQPATRKVLVTGGAGFIGSHLVDAYLAEECEVTIFDNLSTGDPANLNPKARFIEGDLRNPEDLDFVVSGGFDLISHHAAQMDVRRSVTDPAYDAQVNIVGSLHLAERAIRGGVKKFIFASSGGAAYGEPVQYPQDESHPTAPLSPYGCSKLAFEHYLHYFSIVHGLPTAVMRYANVYGPRQNSRGEAGVVAIFATKMLSGGAVTINGTGEQTRDYVHVGDVVRANMGVSKWDLTGPFNIGTGVETSVVELFEQMESLIQTGKRPHHGPAKAGEQLRSVLDGTKLRKLASLLEPLSLARGLDETVQWFRSQQRL